MGNSHLLFEALFQQPVSNNDTTDYLEKFAEQYPYFTAAHFFLLHKTDVSDSLYASRAAKAALLFNNPFWLNYQLEELNTVNTLTQKDTPQIAEPGTSAAINIVKNTPVINEELLKLNLPVNEIEETKTASIAIITPNDVQQTFGQLHNDAANLTKLSLLPATSADDATEITSINDEAANLTELSLLPAISAGDATEITSINDEATNLTELSLLPATSTGGANETANINNEAINLTELSLLPATSAGNATETTSINDDAANLTELSLLPATSTGDANETATINGDATNLTELSLLPATSAGDANEPTIINEEPILPINSDVEIPTINDNNNSISLPKFTLIGKEEMEEEYDSSEEIDENDETEIEPMNIRLNFTQDIATTEETIVFEPLHTSDYFASLGIKLNEDGKPVDKFGRQLKSFTDWLKTMKKIHNDQLQASTEQTDIIIQKMAEKSNTEGDVLTEAMAEVLLHQGKLRKAVELYQKLSLLNPAKSAYFAAKIEQIVR